VVGRVVRPRIRWDVDNGVAVKGMVRLEVGGKRTRRFKMWLDKVDKEVEEALKLKFSFVDL
jgi:hypothetical protein